MWYNKYTRGKVRSKCFWVKYKNEIVPLYESCTEVRNGKVMWFKYIIESQEYKRIYNKDMHKYYTIHKNEIIKYNKGNTLITECNKYIIDNLFCFRQYYFNKVVIVLCQDILTHEFKSFIDHIDTNESEEIVRDCISTNEFFNPNLVQEYFAVDLSINYIEKYAEEFI